MELLATYKQYGDARLDTNKVRAALEADNVKDLHGYYVKVRNARRSTFGWINTGRGKSSITVTIDPLAMDRPDDSISIRPLPQGDDRATDVIRAVRQDHVNLTKTDKFTWTENTTVQVLLPPALAEGRREEVRRRLDLGRSTWAEAEKATQAVNEWREKHTALVQRRDKVESVYKRFNDFDPVKAESYFTSDAAQDVGGDGPRHVRRGGHRLAHRQRTGEGRWAAHRRRGGDPGRGAEGHSQHALDVADCLMERLP